MPDVAEHQKNTQSTKNKTVEMLSQHTIQGNRMNATVVDS